MGAFIVITTENRKLIFDDIAGLKEFIFGTIEDMMLEAEEQGFEVPLLRIHSALLVYFESGLNEWCDPYLLDCYLSDLFTIYKKIL